MRVRHYVEYAVLRVVVFFVNVIPLKIALVFGRLLGSVAWCILRVRREVVLRNITLAFPELKDRKIRKIALKSYENIGRFVIEFARQNKVNRKYYERFITIQDNEEVERIRREKGGVVGLGFHFGNWELLGVVQAHMGINVSFLVGEQRNMLVNRFMNGLRANHGIKLIGRDAGMRGIISTIREGGVVCWLSDQDAGKSGIIVDFFGFPASTPRGAAAFAVKLGKPIASMYLVRTKGPYHKVFASPLFFPREDLSREEAEKEITQRYTNYLQDMIKRYPEMYWWPHRRWKTTGLYKEQISTEQRTDRKKPENAD